MPAGEAFTLRPMVKRDLHTVLTWRNSERVRAVSFGDHKITWEDHVAWYERSKSDDTVEPLLFECDGKPTGVVNFTQIDRLAGSSVWGFYLGDVDAPKGSASIMGFLALDHAFYELDLQKVIGESFVSNEAGVRYHQRLGFREVAEELPQVRKNGVMQDVMRLMVTAERWQELRRPLGQRLFSEVRA